MSFSSARSNWCSPHPLATPVSLGLACSTDSAPLFHLPRTFLVEDAQLKLEVKFDEITQVTVVTRSKDDELLLLASDGLWDVLSNDAACKLARRCLFRAKQR